MSLMTATGLQYKIGNLSILKGIDFEIKAGELIGLIGPNGAGKSTLLRLLTRVEPASSGQILFDGKAIETLSAEQRAKRIGYLVQGGKAHWPVSVEKVVGLGRMAYQKWWQVASSEDNAKILAAMEVTQTLAYRNRIVTTLSGGEHTLVMLARIIASEPQLIFADEPIAALDPYHQLHVMEILRNHASEQRAAVVVLHDLSLAARFCDRLYMLNHGGLYSTGSPTEVMTTENIASVYGVRSRITRDEEGVSVTTISRLSDHHP
ncbi:MAG: ABC transporter ATP-binding protein [Gammaproteobacteria bacterium]|nr:ABC transporter ATP-binding protein [Gammaproteobacteria bacterium]MCZ6578868.1 ABC transporter ATP-binding protein [Gammaproteobacteria bacterium]MCZ6668105.1 ABC transporter ATP-binding protein [Gammaproteobacteria bacterium]